MTTPEARGGRPFAADPVIEAPGPLPPVWAAQLVSCDIEESVGLPDTAVLSFRDADHAFLAATGITIGTKLRVSVVTVQGHTRVRLFTGEVTALELEVDTTGSYTVVRASAVTHRLMRGRRVKAFRNMTTADIVRAVATGAGLTCGKIDSFPVVHQQLSQANVPDWEFLQFLAQESGAYVRVDDDGKLEFVRPEPASGAPAPSTPAPQNPLVLEYGRNLLELRGVLTGVAGAETVEARGWNVTTKSALVATEPSVTSRTVQPGMSPSVVSSAFPGRSKLTVADTPYRTQAETAAVARSLAASVAAGFGELEAVAEGNPRLRAGTPVALGNVGAAFSGRYTVTGARHLIEPFRGYRTTVVVSASPDRSLAGLVTGGNAPPRGPRMPGLAVAVVTDVREPGGGQRGWVKLKFPWLDDTYVSDWVRTVQWGGHGGGGVIAPEVNDEVLVGFEQGDLDSPYVLGGLYNGVDRPSPHDVPLVNSASGKINRRSVVSRSGHRLELLDVPGGASGVRLASGDKKLEVKLDQQSGEIVLTVHGAGGAGGSTVRLTSTGITLDAGTGEVNVRGGSVTLRGTTAVTVDGGAQAVLKGAIVRIN
ncbi:type IV secretion protein Rhs [Kitasatospora xanthocidica]|uniref:VgrG-related protein n=1 Tax=Kitasatospora xanthocidica TaxID=83382 RepID=UPI001672DCFC|nr:VgrG-related protein [Kitasatospora xanthocidica]GHF57244.1 type IV secretion protein Rhs [Kitasatospora xanthocidica]